MRVIIEPNYDLMSQWAANYVVAKINAAKPTAEKPFVLGLPTGSSVVAGAIIGYSGNTGNSSGPHLHFEYRERASYGSSVVDPAPYFVSNQSMAPISPNQSIPVPSAQLKDELAIGAAEVVCDVANVRTQDMRVIGQIRKGTPVTLTGDKQMYNGLPFYKALAVREVWIAAHDSDTQIIDNVK